MVPLLGILVHGACESDPPAPGPDAIFTGRFVTLDAARPEVEALAVTGGRIIAIGARQEVEALAGSATETIEIGGVAVPGFADAHAHVSGVGGTLGGTLTVTASAAS